MPILNYLKTMLSSPAGNVGVAVASAKPDNLHKPLEGINTSPSERLSVFYQTLNKHDVRAQFDAAAELIQVGEYANAIVAYERLAGLYSEERHLCERKLAFALNELGDHKKAFEALLAAKVHGACALEVEDEMWHTAVLLYQKCREFNKRNNGIEQYLRIYPNGKFAEKAKILLSKNSI